jgi:excisionase family DNA binding protein
MRTTANLPNHDAANKALMLNVRDVAKLMQCSDRHVTNMWKVSRMPAPVKLGQLVRWPRKTIEEWIEKGCPKIEKVA